MLRYILVAIGIGLCALGAEQVMQGLPGPYYSRGIAELQADANEILLGLVWLIGGLACGVFALAFPALPLRDPRPAGVDAPGVSPAPAGGSVPGQ